MAMDSGHRFRSLMLYHLSDHSEIDMADKGNHTDVTNGLGSAKWICGSAISTYNQILKTTQI